MDRGFRLINTMEPIFKNKFVKFHQKWKGSIYQSYDWLKFSEEKPVIIKIEEKGEIKAMILAFEKIKKIPLIGKKKILFASGNPMALNEVYLSKVLNEFKQYSKNYFYGLISPMILDYNSKSFKEARFKKFSNHTILLDLSKNEEELWQLLEKKSARWGVKTAIRKGLVFERSEKIETFYEIYRKSANKNEYNPLLKKFFCILKTDLAELFLVKLNNEILAGGVILVDKNNNYSILNLTASSKKGLKMQAMPFLYWNLILYSKRSGLDFFDLGGYDLEAKTESKMDRINKFKKRFGGKIVKQPFYSTNSIYPILRSLFRIYKNRFDVEWLKEYKSSK